MSITIGARARFAVIGSASEGVAIETTSTSFAVLSGRVVLADAASTLSITDVGMTIAITWYAASKRPTVGRFMTVARSARLAELTDVTFRAITAFDPVSRRTAGTTACRLQFDVVEETDPTWGVGSTNLERCQVRQDADEIAG